MMTFLQDLQAAFTYSFEKPWFFTNYSFLLVFSLFLLGYALFNKNSRWKLAYLILFSLFFYYKSSGPFLLLFVGIIICDYFLSKALHRSKGWKRSLLLLFSIAYSLSFLLYFKYTNFFIQNLNVYFSTGFEARDIFLPIGISFYTFQSLSYLIDVARKEIEPSKNLLDYSFYMTFFPHLVAGPIVRAKDFLPQINQPLSLDNSVLREAIFKITVGLTKKLLIADFLAKYVDLVHAAPEGFSGFEHFVAMYSYSFQIYFDFSGYSDIAIGIALLLGYRLKENFQNPYIAQNITSFWRRWHISLSLWLRDYIYIPLGGNRKGTFNTYLFLLITMLVGGFWHGAEWKFVFWGFAHGLLLILHKITAKKFQWDNWLLRFFGVLFTFQIVSLLWVFFRASSINHAFDSIQKMVAANNFLEFSSFLQARYEVFILLFLSSIIVFTPEGFKQKAIQRILSLPLILWPILLIIVLQLILQIRDESIQPFIYFQF